MASVLERASRRWPLVGDPIIAVLLAGATAVVGAPDWTRSPAIRLDSVCMVAVALMVWCRRRLPVLTALVVGALVTIPVLNHGSEVIYEGAISNPPLGAVFLIALALGSECSWRRSLFGLVPLITGLTLASGEFNAFLAILTVGPWLAGLMIASRERVAAQLEVRARELEEEREAFAVQSVRYERARIARELHDVVAHCVSLMVVQANAGAHLIHTDPDTAAEAFDSISEIAQTTSSDIDRLVAVLEISAPTDSRTDLRIVSELVNRARATGLQVTYVVNGDTGRLAPHTVDTTLRVVQESVTNAMKHAPGSPVMINVSGRKDSIVIEVVNGPPTGLSSDLADAGGAYGLRGMNERVGHCGGAFRAGPTHEGGWRVIAELPRQNAPLDQAVLR